MYKTQRKICAKCLIEKYRAPAHEVTLGDLFVDCMDCGEKSPVMDGNAFVTRIFGVSAHPSGLN